MDIYKPCDIRGDATCDLSADLYHRWGLSLGGRFPPGSHFAVGGDVRISTRTFLDALAVGLYRAGMHVVDLGTVPTPMVYFAGRARRTAGCAIVTASHSPPFVNGLKWMVGDLPPDEAEVQALRRDAETTGEGAARPVGSRQRENITQAYCEWLKRARGGRSVPASGRIVLDPGNGSWSGLALLCLGEVFPGVRFTAVHDRADGSFPGRGPDCARPANLKVLCETVRRDRADMGIAFDGDGDRVAFVDAGGHVLTAEEATWVLLHSFVGVWSRRPFVYDIKFSDRIPEAAKRLGGLPEAERSGHAFIRTRMIERRALFGAEISGHYFYEDLDGGDDALFTACRMISLIAERQRPLADLHRECPAIFVTPDLRVAVDAEAQEEALQEVRDAFRGRPQITVDGVRVNFPYGWALVRRSVTESMLTFRFEGSSDAGLDYIVRTFCNRLPRLGEGLYRQFEAETGRS